MVKDFSAESRNIRKEIAPVIYSFNKTRKETLLFLSMALPFLWLVTLPIAYIGLLYGARTVESTVILIFPAAAIASAEAIAMYKAFDSQYRKRVKNKIITKNAQRLFNADYFVNGTMRAGSFYDHYILPKFSTDKTEDEFRLTLSDRKVQIQELRLYAPTDDLFSFRPLITKGLLIRIESRKYQGHHTLAVPKSPYKHKRLKMAYAGLAHYETVPFGNNALSARYTIMSEHPVDAHDIFDPAFTERFIALENALEAKSLSVSFKGDEVIFFAETSRDFFELGHLLHPVSPQNIEQTLVDIDLIDQIIKILKLNPYVGL